MKLLSLSLFFSLTLTSAFAGGEACRLHIKGYQMFMGEDQNLQATVEKIFQKKNIELVEQNDLREGDYTSDFFKNFESYGGLPRHEYIMTKSRKVIMLPCFAIPLCSPIGVDEHVTSIDGIKYNEIYRLNLLTSSEERKVFEKTFKHSYRGETVIDHKSPEYMGSAEQIDLVLAVARKSPDCKTLKKSK